MDDKTIAHQVLSRLTAKTAGFNESDAREIVESFYGKPEEITDPEERTQKCLDLMAVLEVTSKKLGSFEYTLGEYLEVWKKQRDQYSGKDMDFDRWRVPEFLKADRNKVSNAYAKATHAMREVETQSKWLRQSLYEVKMAMGIRSKQIMKFLQSNPVRP
jgi:hypothetical protein